MDCDQVKKRKRKGDRSKTDAASKDRKQHKKRSKTHEPIDIPCCEKNAETINRDSESDDDHRKECHEKRNKSDRRKDGSDRKKRRSKEKSSSKKNTESCENEDDPPIGRTEHHGVPNKRLAADPSTQSCGVDATIAAYETRLKNAQESIFQSKVSRASEKDFPGVSGCEFPLPDQVRSLEEEAQSRFVSRAAGMCEKAIHAIDACTAALNIEYAKSAPRAVERSSAQPDDILESVLDEKEIPDSVSRQIATVEDAVLADMVKLRNVPIAREYVEITLWRRMHSVNAKVIAEVDRLCTHSKMSDEMRSEEPEGADGSFPRRAFTPSLKDLYMNNLTDKFAEDLEKLRVEEDMDGERVQFLLRCLEEGADIFATVKR